MFATCFLELESVFFLPVFFDVLSKNHIPLRCNVFPLSPLKFHSTATFNELCCDRYELITKVSF